MEFWKKALLFVLLLPIGAALSVGLLVALVWLNREGNGALNSERFSFEDVPYSAPHEILETYTAEPITLEPAELTRERVERIKATIEKLKQETLLLEQEVTR